MTAVHRLPAWAQPREIFDLVRLAAPVAVSRASFMLMSLTDAVVLARHRPGELPYVLNAWLPLSIFFGFGIGLMIGVQVLTAELNGQGKGAETGRIFRRGMVVALAYGAFATVACMVVARPLLDFIGFDPTLAAGTEAVTHILAYGVIAHMLSMCAQFYLEALRRPNIATAISMAGVVVNLLLGLAFVPDHGAIGVAWATTGSRLFMTACFLIAVAALTPALKPAPRAPAGEFRRQNSVGVGTGIANMAEWGAFNFTFAIATLVSKEAGAIYGLTVQLMGVIFMIYMGFGIATSVRVAERFGRKDGQGVRDASRLGVVAATLFGLLLALLLVLLREPAAILTLDAGHVGSEGALLAPTLVLMLIAAAPVTLFDGLQVVGAMGLRAQGVVWTPTIIHIGSYIGVMLPVAWWLALPMGYGVWGVFAGVAIASLIAGLGQIIALELAAARQARASS